MDRESKIEELLAPLTPKQRQTMDYILTNVEDERLQECFDIFIGRVLKQGE